MSLVIYFWAYSLRVLNFLLYPFLFHVPERNRRSVSPPTDDLLKISATKLSKLIRTRKLTSQDVVKAYIKRIKEVNHLLNAVVEDRFEEALKEAESIDIFLEHTPLKEEELEDSKPLLGVPVTIKECCSISGLSQCIGTVSRIGIKSDTDGEAVRRLKDSGAIPLLVSNTPEMCIGWYCDNNVTGTTCNPYDITRNSGASSGGEGALLGSGASVIGIGSDVGGSVRFPAMCCGVFGHKPTPRFIPSKGHYPLCPDKKLLDYFTIGPLTRYAEDLKLVMSVLCGDKSEELKLRDKVDLSKLRIYVMEEIRRSAINPPVDNEIKTIIKKGAQFLERTKKSEIVEKHNFEDYFFDSFEISMSLICQLEGSPNLLKGENQSSFVELLKALIGKSEFTIGYLTTLFFQEHKNVICNEKHSLLNAELKEKIMEKLGENGVILCPTFSSEAPKHGEIFFKYLGLSYLVIFNTLGLPATHVPCGLSSNGLPIGIQVVASPGQDRLCLAVAEELEKCFGGWIPPNNPKYVDNEF
ncbi:hypothetical protein WA026_007334 [Henosepilachna vigintioctopunctata]|uniref:Amidase domain-containing protein n=1 Tax=Henosepilachna vigintioctopunctata TaxID=420089 RepID=A0AAW1UWY8_9CUCU